MTKKVYVEKSDIHGKGLFAKKSIKQGETIGKIKPNPSKNDGAHVLWVSEKEGHKVKGPLKYINHSPKPNACYYADLAVVALKDIAPGEEITHNYGEDWHQD